VEACNVFVVGELLKAQPPILKIIIIKNNKEILFMISKIAILKK